ncbi:MAG: hypothetical protein ABIG96_01995 [Candidatus Micrarchaeota archaeon]
MAFTDNVLDALILLEVLVVLYILLKPKGYSFATKEHKREKLRKDKELLDVKRSALKQLNDLLDKRGRLQRFISDAKRKYMKGEITYEAMKLTVDDCERRLMELDAEMAGFEGTY